jgi:hypothetical protein
LRSWFAKLINEVKKHPLWIFWIVAANWMLNWSIMHLH